MTSISIVDPATGDTYIAWVEGGREVCFKNPGKTQVEIGYWNQIPPPIAPELREGLKGLYPEAPLPRLPHEQGWRDVSLDSCSYCPKLAS